MIYLSHILVYGGSVLVRFVHPEYKDRAKTDLFIAAVVILMLAFFYYLSSVTAFVRRIVSLASPFLLGIAICFIQVPIVRKADAFQDRWLFRKKKHPTLRRAISAILAMLLILAVLTAFIWILLPQMVHSAKQLIPIISRFIRENSHWIGDVAKQLEIDFITFDGSELNIAWEQIVSGFSNYYSVVFSNIVNISSSVYKFFFNLFIGLVTGFYIMMSKEAICARVKKLCYALVSPSTARSLVRWTRRANSIFGGFISGKIIDSFIIGVICYFSMLLMRLEYALLISFIIGLCNMIPFFGPIIGAAPSILILLIINPKHALIFTIFILILQQIDGNILGPIILKDHVGISSLWIMVSIVVGGGLFGFIGMLISVPLFSLIYAIVKAWSEIRLRKKGLPTKEEAYLTQSDIKPNAEP